MDRLTHERMNGIKSGYWSPQTKEKLVQALAEYENTGLTPEEIVKLNTFTGSQLEILMMKLQQERTKHQWIPTTERLPEKSENVFVTVNGKYKNITFENAAELGAYTPDEGWILEAFPE